MYPVMNRSLLFGVVLAASIAVGPLVFGSSEPSPNHVQLGAVEARLHIPAGASNQDRLALMRADYHHRFWRLDWKSDSVNKRIGWALSGAEFALAGGDDAEATRRLDQAQALLERW